MTTSNTDILLDARELSHGIGTEVRGLELAGALDESIVAAVRRELGRRAVVLLRDQRLDAPSFAGFARQFGSLQRSANQRYQAVDADDVMLIGNLVVDGESRAMFTNVKEDWHIDQIYKAEPNSFTALFALVVPPHGGDTLFAGMHAAWNALEHETKRRIDTLEAEYSIERLDTILRQQDPSRPPLRKEELEAFPPVIHPLVRVHPESGLPSLYLAPDVMERVVSMGRTESLELIRTLLAHATDGRFVYRHRWRKGDLVIWDNRCTMHTATSFDASKYQRLLYRAIIQ